MSSSSPKTIRLPAEYEPLFLMARLLGKMESSRTPVDAEQYRVVASRVTEALRTARSSDALKALLGAFPAAAELYENLHYGQAGLCLAPMEAALNAEMLTTQTLRQAMARPH